MKIFRSALVGEITKHGTIHVNSKVIDVLLEKCINSPFSSENVHDLFIEGISYLKKVKDGAQECEEEEATIKLVPVNPEVEQDLFICFNKNNGNWENLRIGSRQSLIGSGVKRTSMTYCKTQFLEVLYDTLLNKEKWFVMVAGRRDFLRLKMYLSSLCTLAKKFVDDTQAHCVVMNEDKSKIMFDINLLNAYGNRIVLCHEIKEFTNLRKETIVRFVNPSILGNVKDVVSHGFDVSSYQTLKPFPLYSDVSSLIFTGQVEEFDLEDLHHLNHIKYHRENRLPDFVKNMDQVSLFYLIKSSIELAVKQNNINFKYIIPSFSISDMDIWFLVPVYKMGEGSKPSCALLVNKSDDRWVIYTVLELEQAYLSARIIAPPTGWLNI